MASKFGLARREIGAGDIANGRGEFDILGDAQPVVQREALRHIADLALHALRVAPHIFAQHVAVAVAGPDQRREHLQQRRLTGSVGADDAERLAGRQAEADVLTTSRFP